MTDHDFFSRPDRVESPLYVVTPVFNPVRFRSRWRLYLDFAKRVAEAGGILITVEVAFGDREFVLTDPGNPHHVQLRTKHELWLKEKAINLGVERLPQDWKYVAWPDCDVQFARPDWANETIHQLQHYDVVQMFSQYVDIAPNWEAHGKIKPSFAWYWTQYGEHPPVTCPTYYGYDYRGSYPGAPGLALACTRNAWNTLGGLFDLAILGSGDWILAHALIGWLSKVIQQGFSPGYSKHLRVYEERALLLRKNLGVVSGLALHNWHGPKTKRGYGTREQILIRNGYDPDVDLKPDWQGLHQLTERSPALRDEIRAYFRARDEDSIECG